MLRLKNIPKVLLISVLMLSIFSCTPAYDVRLASASERTPNPRFIVSAADEGSACRITTGTPQIDTVELLLENGSILWRVRAYGQRQIQEITYGLTPPGFTEEIAPSALGPGPTYVLMVHGVGEGVLRFKVAADGLIIPQ